MSTEISPFFLVGAERSGTTMLRLMLTHNPDIFFHHEFVYSVEMIKASGQFPEIKEYINYLQSDRIFLNEGLKIINSTSYVKIVRSFLEQLQERNNKKKIIGATVHRNFQFLPKIWPKSKFIHIVRDPRDVAFSYVKKGWAGHVWTAVDVWINTEAAWFSFQKKLAPSRYLTVQYETLVKNPKDELQRICDFIGVSYSENMLSYAGDSTFSAPDTTLIGQWENKDPKEVGLIEYKAKGQMLKSCYIPIKEDLKVSFLNFRYFYFLSRVRKKLFAIRRYGICLQLLETISRRVVPIPLFRKLVKLKINKINSKYIK